MQREEIEAMLVHFRKPKEIVSYTKYMEPRYDLKEMKPFADGSPKEAFGIAAEFQNDSIGYLKSLV